jgi:hypothetical protein
MKVVDDIRILLKIGLQGQAFYTKARLMRAFWAHLEGTLLNKRKYGKIFHMV